MNQGTGFETGIDFGNGWNVMHACQKLRFSALQFATK
jgi:hypothetical protein